jgi:hypothetical protein
MAIGQGMPNKKTATLQEHEVPAAIRLAIEKDFDAIAGGTWTVFFSTTQQSGRTVATPLWYTYSKKGDGAKKEVRYTPTGKLKSFKGFAKKSDDYNAKQPQAVEERSTTGL